MQKYRDNTEIILTLANTEKVYPNRELYGYGYDAYFITNNQEELQDEFLEKRAKIVKSLVEDIDGRWIAFGIKER